MNSLQMRSLLAVLSLLILSSFSINLAQGIRLELEPKQDLSRKALRGRIYKTSGLKPTSMGLFSSEQLTTLIGRSNEVLGDAIVCKEGTTRKLLTPSTLIPSTSIATTTSKEDTIGEDKAKKSQVFKGKFSDGDQFGHAVHHEHNQSGDIIDIAGMDYTFARRKSPIHN